MKVLSVKDPAFKKYGKVVDNVDFTELVEALKKTPLPEGVVYEPSVAELEATSAMEALTTVTYGEMPIQIGYCNGHNCMLNALEYHRDSEINVAATDAILMLGTLADVEDDFTYDTAKVHRALRDRVYVCQELLSRHRIQRHGFHHHGSGAGYQSVSCGDRGGYH